MAETLSAYALATVAEFANYMRFEAEVKGLSEENMIRALNVASEVVEEAFGRDLVTRGDVTEYHTVERATPYLYTLEWPIISVTSVYEDESWAWGAGDLLTVTTEYLVQKGKPWYGRLVRVYEGGGPAEWLCGTRAIKVVYSGGYKSPHTNLPSTATALPERFVELALKLAAALYKEADRRQWGLSSQSDAAGNWQRWAPAGLTKEMRAVVDASARPVYEITGERDA